MLVRGLGGDLLQLLLNGFPNPNSIHGDTYGAGKIKNKVAGAVFHGWSSVPAPKASQMLSGGVSGGVHTNTPLILSLF